MRKMASLLKQTKHCIQTRTIQNLRFFPTLLPATNREGDGAVSSATIWRMQPQNARQEKKRARVEQSLLSGHKDSVVYLSMSSSPGCSGEYAAATSTPRYLASCSDDGTVRVWNAETNKVVRCIRTADALTPAASTAHPTTSNTACENEDDECPSTGAVCFLPLPPSHLVSPPGSGGSSATASAITNGVCPWLLAVAVGRCIHVFDLRKPGIVQSLKDAIAHSWSAHAPPSSSSSSASSVSTPVASSSTSSSSSASASADSEDEANDDDDDDVDRQRGSSGGKGDGESGNAEDINALAVSPCGRFLAAADDSGDALLFDLHALVPHHPPQPQQLLRAAYRLAGGHSNICSSVVFIPAPSFAGGDAGKSPLTETKVTA